MEATAKRAPAPLALRRVAVLAATVALAVATAVAAPPVVAAGPDAATPQGAGSSVAASLPPLPGTWPSAKLELGLTDSPGGAAALHASGQYRFRYQYLAGGVNTGNGWATWNSPAGKFVDYYVDESVAQSITPVFIYYQLLQSSPAGGAEKTADLNNLKNTATMHSRPI